MPEKQRAEEVISELFAFWMGHPEQLPRSYQQSAKQEPLPRVICDYIAGMTDSYILAQHKKFCEKGSPQRTQRITKASS
jgi:dGTPase